MHDASRTRRGNGHKETDTNSTSSRSSFQLVRKQKKLSQGNKELTNSLACLQSSNDVFPKFTPRLLQVYRHLRFTKGGAGLSHRVSDYSWACLSLHSFPVMQPVIGTSKAGEAISEAGHHVILSQECRLEPVCRTACFLMLPKSEMKSPNVTE